VLFVIFGYLITDFRHVHYSERSVVHSDDHGDKPNVKFCASLRRTTGRPMHDVFGSVRSVTKCAKLLLWVSAYRPAYFVVCTPQNKTEITYHQTRFPGLKIAAKYVCGRGLAPDPRWGSLQRFPRTLSCTGGEG